MSNNIDAKYNTLGLFNYVGVQEDRELQFYNSYGITSTNIRDAENEFLGLFGYASGSVTDRWDGFLRSRGFTGSVDDMLVKFWELATASLDLNFVNNNYASSSLVNTPFKNKSFNDAITFSRGTNATYVDSLGNIAYAPSNLLTYSEQFDNAAWGKFQATISANTTTAPDGTSTAEKLIESSGAAAEHGTNRAAAVAIAAGAAITLSIYAKADTRSRISVGLVNGGYSVGARYTFDLTSGVVSAAVLTGTPISYSASSQNVGDGWYRCVITTILDTASTTANFNVATDNGTTFFYAGDGVSGLYIWGAQLNLDGLQPYNSTTVKNLLGYTQDFDNAAWTKSNSFIQTNLLTYSEIITSSTGTEVTPDAAVAPDGALTMDLVTETATTGEHYPADRTFIPVVGTTYTWSVYAKQGLGTRTLMLRLAAANVGSIIFDLVAGTASSTSGGTIFNASITPVGNDIFRCAVVWTATTASTTVIRTQLIDVGTVYTGDGTSGIYIWGAQLVQGATPGDYQATTTAALAVQYRAPDGSLTADKAVGSAAVAPTILQPTPVNAGTVYTYSVYVKAAELGFVRLQAQGAANTAAAIVVNLSTLAISSTVGAPLNARAVPVGNDFVRISFGLAATTSANAALAVYLCNDASGVYTGDGTSGIYIWGAQLSDSASLDPYSYNFTTAPTAAAYYGPRFDYDPVTLACKGLLIEEQRTNSIRNNTMQGAVAGTPGTLPTNWVYEGAGLGLLSQQIVGTGVVNGINYVDLRLSGTLVAIQGLPIAFESRTAVPAASGQTWSFSTYLAIVGGSFTNVTTVVLRQSGRTSVGVNIENIVSPDLKSTITSSFQRFSSSGAFANAGTAFDQPNLNIDFAAGAIDITLRIGLPQLELGAFATSVIPTTTAAVTRAADVAVIQGANFSNWYNQSEGTLYAEISSAKGFATANNFGRLAAIQDPLNNNSIEMFFDGNANQAPRYRVRSGGANQVIGNSATAYTANTFLKASLAYAENNFAGVSRGVVDLTDTSGVVPVSPTFLSLGSEGGNINYLNGHIARIAYYPRRLADTDLVRITK